MTLEATLNDVAREGKRVLVVGLGARGIECAISLSNRGIKTLIIEKQSEETFRTRSRFATELNELSRKGIEVSFGVDGERVASTLSDVGLVSLSPGVSLESAVVGGVKRLGVPMVSEFELTAFLRGGNLVVVTGSNGKSTTSALIEHILLTSKSSDVVSSFAESSSATYVEEASSYQLEACTVLKPAVSVVLNIHEGHLERHGSIERYAAATAKAMRLQDDGDYAVINGDDPRVVAIAKSCQATVAAFGTKPSSELEKISRTWAHISYRTSSYGSIEVSLRGAIERYETASCRIIGAHNRYNIAAAILVARHLGVSPTDIQQGLESFVPLEHRLEDIPIDATRTAINDSKSTTVGATLAALTAIRERHPHDPILLLIGGLSKAGSWGTLMSLISKWTETRIKVVCFGEDSHLLGSHCRSHSLKPEIFKSLREATNFALGEIRAGGVVLLSPGCSSFDEFSDYMHRGLEFKRYVREYEAGELGVSV